MKPARAAKPAQQTFERVGPVSQLSYSTLRWLRKHLTGPLRKELARRTDVGTFSIGANKAGDVVFVTFTSARGITDVQRWELAPIMAASLTRATGLGHTHNVMVRSYTTVMLFGPSACAEAKGLPILSTAYLDRVLVQHTAPDPSLMATERVIHTNDRGVSKVTVIWCIKKRTSPAA